MRDAVRGAERLDDCRMLTVREPGKWLGTEDSNLDLLIQSQLSYP